MQPDLLAAEQARGMAMAAQLAIVGLLLLCNRAAGQGSKKDSDERCATAIQAQQFALDQFAQMSGKARVDVWGWIGRRWWEPTTQPIPLCASLPVRLA